MGSDIYLSKNYSNSLLAGLPACATRPLQGIQNAAVFDLPRRSHVTPPLISLHWLPITTRIRFKTLVLTFLKVHSCTLWGSCCLIGCALPSAREQPLFSHIYIIIIMIIIIFTPLSLSQNLDYIDNIDVKVSSWSRLSCLDRKSVV